MSTSYYQTLEIQKSASEAEIKRAYRKLALQYHPDKGGSEAKFKEIANAYEVLSDPSRRAEYDKTGSAPPKTSRGGIEAGKVFDYAAREKCWQEIDNALKKHNIGANIFGKEIYPLHSDCNANVGIHILVIWVKASCRRVGNSLYLSKKPKVQFVSFCG